MADLHSKEIRSYNMSQVRGKNTRPELLVRKFLFSKGFRFRLHDKKLPGKPDIILPKYKTLILINGCFWHGHENCKYAKLPSTRIEFWRNKIEETKKRDEKNLILLHQMGWKILTINTCELVKYKKDITLDNILKDLKNIRTQE